MTRITAQSHDTATLTGSPLISTPDGEPATVEYYRRGRGVWQRRESEPDIQICDGLSTRGSTLMADPSEPLVQVIRREHQRSMAAERRERKRSGW